MPEGLKTSGDDEPTPEQLRDHGYAPGGYMVKCRDCGERPWDLDKRATRCKACATAAWRKYSMEAALAAQATKGGGETVEAPAAPVGDLAGLSERATPGPWEVSGRRMGGDWLVTAPDRVVACCRPWTMRVGDERNEHDAAFIVALVNAWRAGCLVEAPATLLPAAHRETAEGIPSEAQLELAAVREMLLADQGDDDDTQILPDIKEDMSLSTMVARCISLLEYRRDVIKAVFDRKSVWVKKYQELCENIKSEEAGGGFDAKACIAENFPQIASEYPNAKAADPVAHGQTVTAEEIARTIATAYGHGHPLGLTSGDGLEYWRANRDRHMKEARAVLALLTAPRAEGETQDGWKLIETAPRDGSEILAARDDIADGFQQVVFWDTDCAIHGWGTKDSNAICPYGFFSHWRPLPAPPDAVQTNGGGAR